MNAELPFLDTRAARCFQKGQSGWLFIRHFVLLPYAQFSVDCGLFYHEFQSLRSIQSYLIYNAQQYPSYKVPPLEPGVYCDVLATKLLHRWQVVASTSKSDPTFLTFEAANGQFRVKRRISPRCAPRKFPLCCFCLVAGLKRRDNSLSLHSTLPCQLTTRRVVFPSGNVLSTDTRTSPFYKLLHARTRANLIRKPAASSSASRKQFVKPSYLFVYRIIFLCSPSITHRTTLLHYECFSIVFFFYVECQAKAEDIGNVYPRLTSSWRVNCAVDIS